MYNNNLYYPSIEKNHTYIFLVSSLQLCRDCNILAFQLFGYSAIAMAYNYRGIPTNYIIDQLNFTKSYAFKQIFQQMFYGILYFYNIHFTRLFLDWNQCNHISVLQFAIMTIYMA